MAIELDTLYSLRGSQVEDLARRINASGSGIIELTSEDYDYPVGAADGVALWALDEGVYFTENNVKVYANSTKDFSSNPKTIVITKTKNPGATYSASIYVLLASGTYTYATRQDGSSVPSSGGYLLRDTDLLQTTGQSTTMPMSQKAITDAINNQANSTVFYASPSETGLTRHIYTDTAFSTYATAQDITDAANKGQVTLRGFNVNTPTQYNEVILANVWQSPSDNDYQFIFIGDGSAYTYGADNLSDDSFYFHSASFLFGNRVQTTGSSTTDLMSQDAASKMIFQDAGTDSKRIRIGGGDTSASVGLYSIGIGYGSGLKASDNYTIAMGSSAEATATQSMAFGAEAKATGTTALAFSTAVAQGIDSVALPHSTFAWTPTPGDYTTTQGVFAVDCGRNNHGYKNSIYRVIRGVHDGEELYDAATVAQGNTLATSAPTTATKGALGQLYTDTTAMHTYQCTAIDNTDPNNILYTWTQRW